MLSCFSCVQPFVTPWNIACQAPLSMEFWSQNTGVGCHALLQGIFPIQGLNPGLPHCRRILYQLSHKGNPRILEWVAYLFSSGPSWPRNWTGVFHIAGGFFTNRAIWKYSLPSTNKSFALLSRFWRSDLFSPFLFSYQLFQLQLHEFRFLPLTSYSNCSCNDLGITPMNILPTSCALISQ